MVGFLGPKDLKGLKGLASRSRQLPQAGID
jgi:hypothetical protein